ncbi:MAG: hypothetical protein GY730_10750 [bacterium]|nr:hypothetical protein [bacterium]
MNLLLLLFIVIIILNVFVMLPSMSARKIFGTIPASTLSMFLYMFYESIVPAEYNIRPDILVLHPLIIISFILNAVISIKIILDKQNISLLVLGMLFCMTGSFFYWSYYVFVVCNFYF